MSSAFEGAMIDTPVGLLSVVVDPLGQVVVGSGFTDLADLEGRLHGATVTVPTVARGFLAEVVAAVEAYATGSLAALDDVPVRQAGSDYRQRVWEAMRKIPAGTTSTYGKLAEASGNARASRAVGSACAQNMVAPFVPCHRVVRAGGSVGNYYYGTDVKSALLAHERAVDDPAGPPGP